MNFAIFGWYHHQNAGDDRMERCLTRWLDGHTLAFLPAGRPPPIELLRTYDGAILGGGGMIRDRGGMFRDVARWIRAAGIPVALAGVSVERETLAPELRRELRDLVERSSFAWFRDRASLGLVGEHRNAFIAPDLTWLYPYDPAPDEGDGLAVSLRKRAGLPEDGWRRALAVLEHELRPWPFYFEGGGDRSVLEAVLPDRSVPAEWTIEPARRAAAVLSSRYHGLIFALQLGRPVLAAGSQPKIRRFLAEAGLEDWAIPEDDPARLGERVAALFAERGRLAEDARRLRARLHDEAWQKTETARARFLDQAANLPPPGRRPGNRLRRLLGLAPWAR